MADIREKDEEIILANEELETAQHALEECLRHSHDIPGTTTGGVGVNQ